MARRNLIVGLLFSFHICIANVVAMTKDRKLSEYGTKEGVSLKCETMFIPRCDFADIYRRFDGKCNNLKHPTRGSVNTVLRRLLPPEYEDGVGQPRKTGKRRELQMPRIISNTMKSRAPVSNIVSQMHVLFGQLLAHDIVHTPTVKNEMGKNLKCDCERPSKDCVNVQLQSNDPMRYQGGESCIPLVRSKPAVSRTDCVFKTREQTTTMSSYIDGTFLYGKSEQEANDLRDQSAQSGELLLIRSPYGGPHKNLPLQTDLKRKNIAPTMDCKEAVRKPANTTCFVSGDVRVNENIGLVAIQTAFARYHNWVARSLKRQNPSWDSDKLFLEARRIVTAILQSITYREYLPHLVGPTHMKRFSLSLTNAGYWNGYDSRYDASITNEFTTAAFRYGHSQVAGTINRPTANFDIHKIGPAFLNVSFFNVGEFNRSENGGSGSILRGFMIDHAERTDTNFVDALRDQMFAPRGKLFGQDLFAINIQRGRDHGLPGYNSYREFCGLTRAKSIFDLADDIPPRELRQLQQLYDDVNDIDLYVGGLAEKHVSGGLVGPTFACILSYTMRVLRRGDRLWHEVKDSNNPFTLSQLQSIRRVGLASILCQTGEDMKYVITRPLEMRRGEPGYVSNCVNVPKLNLKLWGRTKPSPTDPYSSLAATEWTPWFVTSNKFVDTLSLTTEFSRIKATRPDEICQDIVNWQLRYVKHDSFIQIRFSCKVGTLSASDFPFQATDQYKWTKWIVKQSVSPREFPCNDIIAIQAKSVDDDTFALETGDVFEKFGPDGFSCEDRHQVNGKCHRFKVRALCPKDTNDDLTASSSTKVIVKVPDNVRKISELLCKYYGACCENYPNTSLRRWIPLNIRQAAKNYCVAYDTCCDV